jgi:hypothetical protein
VRARFCEPEMDVAGTYVDDKSVNAIRVARVRNEASRMKMRLETVEISLIHRPRRTSAEAAVLSSAMTSLCAIGGVKK